MIIHSVPQARIFFIGLLTSLLTLFILLVEPHVPGVWAYNNYNNPPCFWPYTSGVRKTLYYKFGSALSNYQLWVVAYNSSVSDWNAAQSKVQYTYSSSAASVFDVYNAQDNKAGKTLWYCSGTTMTRADSLGNVFYDNGYSANLRRSITGHELGHGISLGHSTVSPSLMGPNPNPNVYYAPLSDDIAGVNARFP